MDAATQTHKILACVLNHNAETVIHYGGNGKPKTSSCILGIQLVLVTDKDHAFW